LKRCRCRGHHPPLKPHRQKYSVDLWFDYLRRVGIVPTPTFVEPAVEAAMLTAFCDWMRRQRGVSQHENLAESGQPFPHFWEDDSFEPCVR
jgi:hypothetical protein